MKVDLNKTPFSMRNSYMAISELAKDYRLPDAGLYLRTVRGSAERSMIAKLIPLFDGKEEECVTSMELATLSFIHGDQTIEICFSDEQTMLFRGSAGTGIILDFMTEKYKNDYIYDIQHSSYTLYMANCYKNNCRYLIWSDADDISLEQEWDERVAKYSRLRVENPNGFMLAIREVDTEWTGKIRKLDFAESRHKTQLSFLGFLNHTGTYPLEFQARVMHAAYLEWSSLVEQSGFMTRDSMLLSKSWLTDKAGWNLNYAALALSKYNPTLAWKQFMVQFDMMDESGRLADSFNDSYIRWNHVKPPIQGWILSKMMKNMKLDRDQIIEAYLALTKATTWWDRYRDFRREGLFIYDHAKDSAWEYATAFSQFPPIATPELQAFLIIQMETLAELCSILGIEDEKEKWMKRSKKILNNLVERCFRDNLPVPLHCNSGTPIETDCILPYEVLILGERLPKEIRDACIEVLRSDKFRTPYGFATESPASPRYQFDKKYCGPIWGPATLFILEGLKQCGETELFEEELKKYLDLVKDQGIAEGYNALTGETLEPTLYTTTACAFMIILHEYTEPGIL